ncbi:MAG: ribonuclease Y [Candidatus Nealsonbacteria bacterium CG_4_8_14_3_um_filter_39_7]|nr:MAG: ribonuclease Y [Candidatus Nealsonbacteria bacterium CG_4_8_14_3_um_filter_39_7]
MSQLILLIAGIGFVFLGSLLGYFARQSIAKRDWETIEGKLQKRISEAKENGEKIIKEAKEESIALTREAREREERGRMEILKTERALLKRETVLDGKSSTLDARDEEIAQKVEKLKKIKENLEELRNQAVEKLEKTAGMSKKEAKDELLGAIEKECQQELTGKMMHLEQEGREAFEREAKKILATAIQKYGLSQAQEITTSTLSLPSEEIKGRIIGKEGRNIRALERLTGVEIMIDDVPEAVVISGFDAVRRQIAKTALEKLIKDGKIQPAKIEEKVEEAKQEILIRMKKAGEAAAYDLGLVGLDPKLIQLLGRLKYRTSYGQNVLLHSMEVAYLASALADEIGADQIVCKKAGLFHDIGKAVDHQVEGSHVNIGIRILEKLNTEPDIIKAMKSHHEEYPYETIESVLIQVADQISGARPGARKDTLENYLKRLGDLEKVALSFAGVEKAWALQAGREIRIFVKPGEVDDSQAKKLAKEVAGRVQEELKYPGEIKVTVIRETRVVEYAK